MACHWYTFIETRVGVRCVNLNTTSVPQRNIGCTSRIYYGVISTLTSNKDYNSGSILGSLRTIKRIHLHSPSPIQYCQVYHIKIFKRRILQYWDDWNLTHIEDWELIYLKSFKRAQDKTTVHIVHFIIKFISNALPTMTIL